ncbi:MAG: hypothetical protein PHY54_04755 [Methylococcales bacterium]|nr:hypothetical protein [Methylococcales bacterium]
MLDIDVSATLAFLTGDSRRFHFDPYFKVMYSLIVLGLFSVALVLLYAAGMECIKVAHSLATPRQIMEIPFEAVIYLNFSAGNF